MQVACHRRETSLRELPPRPPRALAPAWHTRALIALLLVVPVTGLAVGPSAAAATSSRALGSYLPSIVVSVALAGYVTRFGLGRSILRSLLGRAWRPKRRALEDLGLAAGLALLILALDASVTRVLLSPDSLVGRALLPTTASERAAWLVLALAAGVGEELVYRGYLQAQLSASCQSHSAGVLLQALLFGIAHGEQGGAVVARFAGYGVLFGCLALWRGSLLPGLVAHVAVNLNAGLFPG